MSALLRAGWAAPCPRCQSAADEPCRTLTTGRCTDTHTARFEASNEARRKADTDAHLRRIALSICGQTEGM